MANKSKFTEAGLEAYRKASDEIRVVFEIADARWAEGEREGRLKAEREGRIEGKRETLVRLLGRAGITLTDAERALIDTCVDADTLDGWIVKLVGAKTAAEVLA